MELIFTNSAIQRFVRATANLAGKSGAMIFKKTQYERSLSCESLVGKSGNQLLSQFRPKISVRQKTRKRKTFFLPEVSKIPKIFEISVRNRQLFIFRRGGAFQLLSFILETQRSKLQRQRRRQYGGA